MCCNFNTDRKDLNTVVNDVNLYAKRDNDRLDNLKNYKNTII